MENEHVVLAPIGLRPPGRRINYRVDLEALGNETLFFAGTPETLDLRARALYRYEASSFRLGHATPPGFHYDAFSLLDDPPETSPVPFSPPVLPLASRDLYLQLPTLDRRIADLARTFAAGATGDLDACAIHRTPSTLRLRLHPRIARSRNGRSAGPFPVRAP